MTHGLWAFVHVVGLALRSILLYFAAILRNLTWPQVFLVFLLIFPRQIRSLLITLNKLLEKMKTIHWGELKGDLKETSEAVEKAEQSQGETRQNLASVPTGGEETPVLGINISQPHRDSLAIEDPNEEYSRFIEEEARREAKYASLGFPSRPTPRSPIERFLSVSQAIENSLSKLYFLYGLQDPLPAGSSVRRMAAGLLSRGVITEEMYDSFGKYQRLRNRVVHSDTNETEVKEAFLLGRRLYGLIAPVPLPEYRVAVPPLPVFDQPDMQEPSADIHVVLVESEKGPPKIPFLTTTDFHEGMVFVPTTKQNDRLRGYFYFLVDGQVRRIAGQGLEFTILYSRK